MRTGNLITADFHQPHLPEGTKWLEAYPDGVMKDIELIASIPPDQRSYSAKAPKTSRQSPILVAMTSPYLPKVTQDSM